MALLALRWALKQDSSAADIVYKWYKKNLHLYDVSELQFLLGVRSSGDVTTKTAYRKKSEVWLNWAQMLSQRIKEIENGVH